MIKFVINVKMNFIIIQNHKNVNKILKFLIVKFMIELQEDNVLNVKLNIIYLIKWIHVKKLKTFQIVLNMKEQMNAKNVIKVFI